MAAHNLKAIREAFKANGVFYSDHKMAELLRSYLPNNVDEIYDPTCGDGALLAVFPDEVRKYGQELDPTQAEAARVRLVNAEIVAGDTLTTPAFRDHKFKAIIANPPFSVKYNPELISVGDSRFSEIPCMPPPSKADYCFLLHCLDYLTEDGVAAVLNFPGICYRGQREGKLREWMIRNNYIDRVVYIEGGYFVDTKVSTVLIILKKNRSATSVIFENHELGLSREVSFAEIESSAFSLSVNSYVHPPEPERPPVDIRALESKAREGVLHKIKIQIEFSQMVAMMEGWSIDEFLDDIISLAKSYKKVSSREEL